MIYMGGFKKLNGRTAVEKAGRKRSLSHRGHILTPAGAAVFLSLALLCLPAGGQEKKTPLPLNILSFTFTSMVFADTAITFSDIQRGGREFNPFWQPIIKYPAAVITLDMAICLGVSYLARILYKHEKALGIALLVLANVVQGFVVYAQLR